MLEDIVLSGFFMIFELFILARWLENREKEREQKNNHAAWLPFRKMMLDAVVRHADDLMAIASDFELKAETLLNSIRDNGRLDSTSKDTVIQQIDSTYTQINKSRDSFFNILQTVAPSLQPYAAQYCNEVLWFGDAAQKSLDKARTYIADISEDMMGNTDVTSHQLNGVSAMVMSIKMFREMRFSGFKSNFTQSVWKTEELHYYEKDGEFLSPKDYAMALEVDKSNAELQQIPRTMPIRSFFEK